VPEKFVGHWQSQIENYTSLVYETIDKDYKNIFIEEYDILLCPAIFYNDFVFHYQDLTWNRVILMKQIPFIFLALGKRKADSCG
jgi:hypothetical protein